MLILQRLSGLAVLLLTLHFVHVLHHFFVEAPHDSPVFWAGMVTAVVVWILSFMGGCLLLRRSRWFEGGLVPRPRFAWRGCSAATDIRPDRDVALELKSNQP